MKTKKMVLAALFIALSFIGANIKVMQTIAFDSMPGFLGTLILGPVFGAIIGAAGHFLTALTSGFPMTLPVHIIIMFDMALTMLVFGFFNKLFSKKSQLIKFVIAALGAVIMNGPISLTMVSPLLLPVMGKAALFAMAPALTGVAALNVVIAIAVYKLLPEGLKNGNK